MVVGARQYFLAWGGWSAGRWTVCAQPPTRRKLVDHHGRLRCMRRSPGEAGAGPVAVHSKLWLPMTNSGSASDPPTVPTPFCWDLTTECNLAVEVCGQEHEVILPLRRFATDCWRNIWHDPEVMLIRFKSLRVARGVATDVLWCGGGRPGRRLFRSDAFRCNDSEHAVHPVPRQDHLWLVGFLAGKGRTVRAMAAPRCWQEIILISQPPGDGMASGQFAG